MQESSERASTKRRIRLQWWVEPSVRAAFRCSGAQQQQPPTPGGVAPSQGNQAGTPLWPHEHGKYVLAVAHLRLPRCSCWRPRLQLRMQLSRGLLQLSVDPVEQRRQQPACRNTQNKMDGGCQPASRQRDRPQ